MDNLIFYIVIAVIIIIVIIAVIVSSVLFRGNTASQGQTDSSGNGQPVAATPLGDTHVCVTQINNYLNSLPTDRASFCAALKQGIPSACSTLVLLAVDENGDDLITFKWSGGKFIGDFGNDCKLTGKDIIMFKAIDHDKSGKEISEPFTVTQIILTK